MGEELRLLVATYGHAEDGNLHANLLYDGPHQRALVEKGIRVGHAKREYLAMEQAEGVLAPHRRLKEFFDPTLQGS